MDTVRVPAPAAAVCRGTRAVVAGAPASLQRALGGAGRGQDLCTSELVRAGLPRGIQSLHRESWHALGWKGP